MKNAGGCSLHHAGKKELHMSEIHSRKASSSSHLRPARRDRRPDRRSVLDRTIYRSELHRYRQPHALSRGARLSFTRRTVTRWDV
jgi:hypothetical protein